MTLTNAPTLTTKNLILRGPQKSDLAPFTQFLTTSERMTHLGGTTDEGSAWRGFIAGIGHWQWHGFGFFIVTDKATGTPQGRMGILMHTDWPEHELAYHLFDNGEGKSYGFETGVAVRQWAGETLNLPPLMSMIDAANTRSIALARRLGAKPEAEITHDGDPAIMFRHLAYDHPDATAQWAEVSQ